MPSSIRFYTSKSSGKKITPSMLDIKSPRFYQIIFSLCLCMYVAMGIRTEIFLMKWAPALLGDWTIYERALNNALEGKDPYSIRSIGLGYLYPPPALFVVEAFHGIEPSYLKSLVYSAFNIIIMVLIITGIAKYYGYSVKSIWYWYVFCLGFAPFLELLQVGQINAVILLGLFMLFFWLDSSSILSGFGLSLAILTKVTPVVFLGYLVVFKKNKTIAATLILAGIIVLLSILRHGISPTLEYPEILQWISSQFPIDDNSQSFVSKLVMQFGFLYYNPGTQMIQRCLIIYIAVVIIASGLLTMKGKQPREPLFITTAFAMTISPNIMWYHHYVFILLPMLIWMGWKRLDSRVVTWCLLGLTIAQVDRFSLTFGLITHIFIHISILLILLWQIRQFNFQKNFNQNAPLKKLAEE